MLDIARRYLWPLNYARPRTFHECKFLHGISTAGLGSNCKWETKGQDSEGGKGSDVFDEAHIQESLPSHCGGLSFWFRCGIGQLFGGVVLSAGEESDQPKYDRKNPGKGTPAISLDADMKARGLTARESK